jgi:hypothetical protein
MPRRVALVQVDPAFEPEGSRWNPIDLTDEPEPELLCDEEIQFLLQTPPRIPRLDWRIDDYENVADAYVAANIELNQQRAQALDRRIRRRLF